jgi:hypothetical protein
MNHLGITLVSIAFWVFIAVVAVAGMIHDYRKRQLAVEPLRAAIEHGQLLTPEILAKLSGQEERGETLDPKLLRVGGIITCASGIGVALLAPFVALVFPPYHWIVLGVGIVAICVGVGLMVAAKSLRA